MTKIRESFILGIFAEPHSRTNHICAELESVQPAECIIAH